VWRGLVKRQQAARKPSTLDSMNWMLRDTSRPIVSSADDLEAIVRRTDEIVSSADDRSQDRPAA
jgi:hypothetical protein